MVVLISKIPYVWLVGFVVETGIKDSYLRKGRRVLRWKGDYWSTCEIPNRLDVRIQKRA